MADQRFLSLEHITVRYLDKTLFTGLSWEVKKGEQWAIVGGSGSGKTSLLQTVAGKFNVINGAIRHHFYEDYLATHAVTDPYFTYRDLIAQVSSHHDFRNRSNMVGDFYYQQRFNSSDSADALTVREYLFPNGEVADNSLEALNILPLLDKEVIKLSNGETRRTMIAKALLKKPVLLMLDSPFVGLDVQARKNFREIVDNLAAAGTTMLLVTSPTEIPDAITHVLVLEDGRVAGTYTREAFQAMPHDDVQPEAFTMDADRIAALVAGAPAFPAFEYMVRMQHVQVQYGGNLILYDINWEVKAGDKWALSGPNGAGKSTLLSLINADNPQGYANDLILFDRKRGSGESIWDIKKYIGFVSPELHQYFNSAASCAQVAGSGFYDTIGYIRTCTAEQLQLAEGWMEVLGIGDYTKASFKSVPDSVQRLTLLARALVKNPPLLILDEPCQGLDAQQKAHFKHILETLCSHLFVTMIYVTHYEEELPACVNKFIRLQKGRMV
ncbi:ATP-binding cassette domain-containing protein [Chitinophaga horti]|uniref:ATP-binding cassette domain-containing protein n=1 Tax=Chitinophaga horti TaxID=2920382 RepID=A0ABY6IXX6_9BACT|nr:ATP-binding cassette domain-containing protein [Chitinophaga horti]UYQ92239.1 ATP-binding cassette domain-containing protein [Chitinophaga horti]